MVAIPIWKSFVDYVLSLHENGADTESTRQDLLKAVAATSSHVAEVSLEYRHILSFAEAKPLRAI